MSDKKISQLNSASAIDGSEVLAVVQNGDTVKVAVEDLRTYKVYSALLSQSGTDAPVATVLENTIGDIVWTYVEDGVYSAYSSSGLFIEGKTIVLQDQQTNRNDADVDYCIRIIYNTANQIIIATSALDTSAINNALLNTPIEIRVYN